MDAGRILHAALAAVEPGGLVRAALEARAIDAVAGRVLLLAMGKAADAMASAACAALGDRIAAGVVVGPANGRVADGALPAAVRRLGGGHPLPDASSVAAARAVGEVADAAGPEDRVLCLISGGASAMVCEPAEGVSLDELRTTTALLMKAGATIGELNAVRKHLDRLKGGGLARRIAPARALAFLLSDVPGDRLDVIASGPLSADPSGWSDVDSILRRLGLRDRVPSSVAARIEGGLAGHAEDTVAPDDPVLDGVEIRVIGSASDALAAAAREAARLGYAVITGPANVAGEARDVGVALGRGVRNAAPGTAILQAGETTVTVSGGGRGGRNQEVALGALLELAGDAAALVGAFGTDGIDGPTDAAGAIVTGSSALRAAALDLDPAEALRHNDAYPFFDRLSDLIRTGPTGTNVMDLMLGLRGWR